MGFATTTRGGGTGFDEVTVGLAGTDGGGVDLGSPRGNGGGGMGAPLGGKRGAVFADIGLSKEAGGGGSEPGKVPVGGRVGIGLVTAVDQVGGTPCCGAGTKLGGAPSGKVVAPEALGRKFGGATVGLGGRGGRLIRSVSRLGGVEPESEGGGLAASAMETFLSLTSGIFNGEVNGNHGK